MSRFCLPAFNQMQTSSYALLIQPRQFCIDPSFVYLICDQVLGQGDRLMRRGSGDSPGVKPSL